MTQYTAPPESMTMSLGPQGVTCADKYNAQVRDAIVYLQKHLHHNKLGCRADATTEERIKLADLSPAMAKEARRASKIVTRWLHYDIRWMISFARKYVFWESLNNVDMDYASVEPFYSQVEIVTELCLAAYRILYNWNEDKIPEPHHYYKTIMLCRKEDYRKAFSLLEKVEHGVTPEYMEQAAESRGLDSIEDVFEPHVVLCAEPGHLRDLEERRFWSDLWDMLVGYSDSERLAAVNAKKWGKAHIRRPISKRARKRASWASFVLLLSFAQRWSYDSAFGLSFSSLRAWYISLAQQ
jgi:hypothetical protein